MSKTNCINCGAAKDTSDVKCPFCGTTYFDFTAIDFTSDDPVACAFVLPYSKNKVVMTMLARPRMNGISIEPSYASVYGGWGNHALASFCDSVDVDVNISFEPVVKPGTKHLFSLSAKE